MSLTHEERALANFQEAQKTTSLEWSITMLFYAAVHAADHAIFNATLAPETGWDHRRREQDIARHRDLRGIEPKYVALKKLSTTARYCPKHHPMAAAKRTYAEQLAIAILLCAGLAPPK